MANELAGLGEERDARGAFVESPFFCREDREPGALCRCFMQAIYVILAFRQPDRRELQAAICEDVNARSEPVVTRRAWSWGRKGHHSGVG